MKLANIFQNGMVLQRDVPLKFWGTAAPCSKIEVSGIQVISRETGEWEATLPALPAGGPHQFKFSCETGDIILDDVLLGDVWLCSGQSNMELPMVRVKRAFPGEVENTINPQIKQFHVPVSYAFDGPNAEIPGERWISVTPEQTDTFSATGYFFAKKIHQELGVPVGIILSAAGGTPIEAWLSETSLEKFPEHLPELHQVKGTDYVSHTQASDAAFNAEWFRKLDAYDLGLHEKWMEHGFDDSQWQSIDLTHNWNDYSILQEPGAIWLRKDLELPEGEGKIDLGTLADADFVYVNGTLVGSTGYQYPPRIYPIQAKAGINTVVIRIIAGQNIGGFTFGKDRHIQIGNQKIAVDAGWKFKRGIALPKQPSTTFFQNYPTGCFNAMIAPLQGLGLKGILWYQGESNAGNPDGYGERLKELVASWREGFGQPGLPFIGIQLANWNHQGLNWAYMRQEQERLLELPNTGLAIALGAGEHNDLHPLDKKTVGQRLALQALKAAYGKGVTADGPKLVSIDQGLGSITLEFDQKLEGRPQMELEIGDAVVPANARIDANAVILTGVGLEAATYVRYAWSNDPDGLLYNGEKLPAAPFRMPLSRSQKPEL
ncbi:MAG: sialate O-acetylesterase [Turicibacter sp.]|nr:sialate O-acetylesterase [Turicibacter sp.]